MIKLNFISLMNLVKHNVKKNTLSLWDLTIDKWTKDWFIVGEIVRGYWRSWIIASNRMKIFIWKEWEGIEFCRFFRTSWVFFVSEFKNLETLSKTHDTQIYGRFRQSELPWERLFYRRNRLSYILVVIVTIMLIFLSRFPVDWLSIIDRRKCRQNLQKMSFSVKKVKCSVLVMLNL